MGRTPELVDLWGMSELVGLWGGRPSWWGFGADVRAGGPMRGMLETVWLWGAVRAGPEQLLT